MQIRTGLTLGVGIGIGMLIGMGISEDKKDRFATSLRRKLIQALGAEEKKGRVVQPDHHVSYTSYYNRKEQTLNKEIVREKIANVDEFRRKVLNFDKEQAAKVFLDRIKRSMMYGDTFMTAYDLLVHADKEHLYDLLPPVQKAFWTKKQIDDAHIASYANGWEIIIADPN